MFAPNITLAGGGGNVKQQADAALTEAYRLFETHMRRYAAEKKRTAFT